MANILGIFTAIILAVAAFVAVKNKARLETEIVNRDSESQMLATSQARLLDRQEVLRQLPIDRAELDAQAAAKTEAETKLKESNDEVKSQIESKTAKISANKQQLDEIREKISKVGNISELAPKMKTMRAELEELEQSINDNEAALANLIAQNTAAKKEEVIRKDELNILSQGKSLPNLSTRIRNIYPTWGFVTLADGNNGGVTASSTLDVVRDGETVARLLVTAVESRSATASIVPDSISDDVTLMVGDRVVASSEAGKKSASN